MVLSYTALIFALGWPYIFGSKIKPGDSAERDYIAHEQTRIVDVDATRQAREDARDATVPVYRRDQRKITASQQKLAGLLDDVKGRPANEPSALKVLDEKIISETAQALKGRDYNQWRHATESATNHFLRTVPLYPDGNSISWRRILYEFLPDDMPPALREHTADLVTVALQPNMVLDPEATHDRYKQNIARTEPITKQVDSGTLLIERGSKLSADDVSLLNQMGITHTREPGNVIAIAISLLAAFCLFGLYLFTYAPKYFFSPSALALMATVCVVTSGVAAAVGRDFAEFVPLPAAALTLSVIFGRRISFMLTMLVLLFMKVSDLVDSAHLVGLAAASGMALGTNITKRKELMVTGILVGVMQALGWALASMVFRPDSTALPLVLGLVRNLLGGLSSSIVAIGSLPFLEIMFGILTPFRVAELSEPDQPLLRQLEEKAPGTYQHSLAVANLAEAGAKAIGADVNLVRAGAMYHDIGKMANSRYFIENQLGDKNPHDEIQPEESRARVLAHVTDGLEMAKQFGLPQKVKDFIPEHQGTTVMAYFYHKACVRDGHDNVKESDYRYPGPKPQCKETAIVMLADVSEAVTHSMRDPSQEEVETAIGNVFKARWDDGQFDESELTLEELDKVKQAFVRVWRTLHHDRLKYPSTTTGKMPVPPTRNN
jgi:putative nucleotidyltransferase with HDIG domain